MKKNNPYHGVLWELTLNENLGFGYVQIVDRSIYGGWGFLVKILNYRSEVSKNKISEDEFKKWDLLCNLLVAAERVPKQGSCKWKKMGVYPLTEYDVTPILFKVANSINDKNEEIWFVNEELGGYTNYEIGFSYDQVKHLGYFNPVIFLHSIHHRITMEWMKVLGMDFESYITTESDNEHIRTMKRQIIESVPYSEVPKEIRGKVKTP